MTARFLLIVILLGSLAASATAQPPPQASTELGNFGDTAGAPARLVLTSPAQREAWRSLEDRQLAERRRLEDRFAEELRALMARQAEERDALLRALPR
jgi:hypothetical protein